MSIWPSLPMWGASLGGRSVLPTMYSCSAFKQPRYYYFIIIVLYNIIYQYIYIYIYLIISIIMLYYWHGDGLVVKEFRLQIRLHHCLDEGYSKTDT